MVRTRNALDKKSLEQNTFKTRSFGVRNVQNKKCTRQEVFRVRNAHDKKNVQDIAMHKTKQKYTDNKVKKLTLEL